MKTSENLIIQKFALLLIGLVIIANTSLSAQVKIASKKTVDKVISPQTSQNIYNSFIANLIKSDLNDVENISKKFLGFENENNESSEIATSNQIGSFFVSRKDLIDFLYDSGKTNPNLFGINIWFTNNDNQIAITKATSSSKDIFEDLGSNYKLLISKPLSKNTPLKSNFVNSKSLLSIIKNVNIPINGYFVGRLALITKILNADESINSSYAGFEFIVRERNNQKFICFYGVKTYNNKDFFGIAKFKGTSVSDSSARFALDKMGGSRPCPPYCRKD